MLLVDLIRLIFLIQHAKKHVHQIIILLEEELFQLHVSSVTLLALIVKEMELIVQVALQG